MGADTLQWLGCITGVAGSLLLALNTRQSGWGFVLFLVSNGFWAAYGFQTGAFGLLAMQGVFTITSLIGIQRWLFSRQVFFNRSTVTTQPRRTT